MKKLLLATITTTLLIGACGNSEESTKSKDKELKKETVNKDKKEKKKKEQSAAKKETSKSNEKATNEPSTEESNTTEQSVNNTQKTQSTTPEQCIMSGLVECEGVTEEQKYTAYKNLVANGSLPQGTPGSGNLEQAVQDSFAIKNGQYNNWEEINKERQAQINSNEEQSYDYEDNDVYRTPDEQSAHEDWVNGQDEWNNASESEKVEIRKRNAEEYGYDSDDYVE
ncbi:hypothetical protein [Mammaliicoccus vitulinus]|uniref:hypothetical protein n=1 Tax=Mammaliicoccus vitulinus TaxID=71237 RepID=UPI0028D3CB34|nr:hypothetical protein [Mammaliicoccus vitulinus]